jgi:hypothetical protein
MARKVLNRKELREESDTLGTPKPMNALTKMFAAHLVANNALDYFLMRERAQFAATIDLDAALIAARQGDLNMMCAFTRIGHIPALSAE